MRKKYQVFVSSTYLDLKEERKKVANAIAKADHIPVGMELFPATVLKQWIMIKELIDTCDYYILIIAGRYGSIAPTFESETPREISYTQKEYEYAHSKGIPILTFFIHDHTALTSDKLEKTEKQKKKLNSFIKLIKENGYYFETWENPDELSRKALNALTHAIEYAPRPGWIRSDRIIDAAKDYGNETSILEKTIYYKFLHLRYKETNNTPIYKKLIHRTNQSVDIYDEYLTIRVTKFNEMIKRFQSYDRTNGTAVEASAILPFILSLSNTDKKMDENPTVLQPMIIGPSNVFVTISHCYNGFQKNNQDIGTKADKVAEILRVIVDFTSIENYESLICKQPKVIYSYHDISRPGKLIHSEQGTANEISPGIFYAEKKNIQIDEVLRIEFE